MTLPADDGRVSLRGPMTLRELEAKFRTTRLSPLYPDMSQHTISFAQGYDSAHVQCADELAATLDRANIVEVTISHDDACLLSRVFNRHAFNDVHGNYQEPRINEFLKMVIEASQQAHHPAPPRADETR